MKRLDWTETDKREALKCESLNDNENLIRLQNESQPYIAFLNSTIFLLTGSQTRLVKTAMYSSSLHWKTLSSVFKITKNLPCTANCTTSCEFPRMFVAEQ